MAELGAARRPARAFVVEWEAPAGLAVDDEASAEDLARVVERAREAAQRARPSESRSLERPEEVWLAGEPPI